MFACVRACVYVCASGPPPTPHLDVVVAVLHLEVYELEVDEGAARPADRPEALGVAPVRHRVVGRHEAAGRRQQLPAAAWRCSVV